MQPVYMLRGICKNYYVHNSAAKNRANEKLKISTENWRTENIWRETVLLGAFFLMSSRCQWELWEFHTSLYYACEIFTGP